MQNIAAMEDHLRNKDFASLKAMHLISATTFQTSSSTKQRKRKPEADAEQIDILNAADGNNVIGRPENNGTSKPKKRKSKTLDQK